MCGGEWAYLNPYNYENVLFLAKTVVTNSESIQDKQNPRKSFHRKTLYVCVPVFSVCTLCVFCYLDNVTNKPQTLAVSPMIMMDFLLLYFVCQSKQMFVAY